MATHGFPGFGGYHTCDACDMIEGRVFTDTWTGMDLCLSCLNDVAYTTTNSPEDEGDNLRDELVKAGKIEAVPHAV